MSKYYIAGDVGYTSVNLALKAYDEDFGSSVGERVKVYALVPVGTYKRTGDWTKMSEKNNT